MWPVLEYDLTRRFRYEMREAYLKDFKQLTNLNPAIERFGP